MRMAGLIRVLLGAAIIAAGTDAARAQRCPPQSRIQNKRFKIQEYRCRDREISATLCLGKRSPLQLSNPVLDNDVLRNDTCNQLK